MELEVYVAEVEVMIAAASNDPASYSVKITLL